LDQQETGDIKDKPAVKPAGVNKLLSNLNKIRDLRAEAG